MTVRRLVGLASAIALTVVVAGCGDDDPAVATDGDPTKAVDGVDVGVEADLTVADDAVTGTVQVTNDGDDEVWVFDGMAAEAGAGTRYDPSTYALLDAGDDVVEVARRAVAPPEDVDLGSLEVFAVRRLPAGEAITAEITVPLPPTPTGPYATLGQDPPDDPGRLIVCVGAVPAEGATQPRTGDGVAEEVEGLATHGGAWLDAQGVACSRSIELG